jgi:hypothetical protein
MEINPLSKRASTVFKRYVEMNFDDVLERAKKAKKNLYDTPYFIRVSNWTLKLDYYMGFHQDDCEKDKNEDISFNQKCDECDYQKVRIGIIVYYEYNPKKNDLRIDSLLLDADIAIKENMYEFLNKIEGKQWTICPCNSIAKKDGFCEECYIHSYERTEEEGGNCAICYENNGRWIKLECGHIFHTYCIRNVVTTSSNGSSNGWIKKCPLCRREWDICCDNPKTIYDCYDV